MPNAVRHVKIPSRHGSSEHRYSGAVCMYHIEEEEAEEEEGGWAGVWGLLACSALIRPGAAIPKIKIPMGAQPYQGLTS